MRLDLTRPVVESISLSSRLSLLPLLVAYPIINYRLTFCKHKIMYIVGISVLQFCIHNRFQNIALEYEISIWRAIRRKYLKITHSLRIIVIQ